jgi:hypothetical protein
MPVRVVFDHTRTHITSQFIRHLSWLAGVLLLGAGLLAAVAAIPLSLVVAVHIVAYVQRDPSQTFPPDFPLRELETGFALSLLMAFVGLRYGLRVVRGTRRTVLFLRRFGFDGAQQVVTFAVVSTIGGVWRLVTLDDAEMAPVGVDATAKFVFGLAKPAGRIASAAASVIFRTFTWTIYGMFGVIAVEVARARDVGRLFENGTLDRYLAVIERLMSARVPIAFYDFSLPGIFAVLATAFGIAFIGIAVTFVILLSPIPLFPVVWMAGASARALREAETWKTATVQHPPDISRIAKEISRRSQRIFAPRIVVVRVESLLWPATVSALARGAAAVIVDISDPTENVLWELEEMERLCRGRYVLIGDETSIRRWSAGIDVEPQSFSARFATQLGNLEVLAYATDEGGMRRFARALHGRLRDLPSGEVT